jgi:hypothetical protein
MTLWRKDSRNESSGEAHGLEEATSLETIIRRRARGLIDAIVEEELNAALGAAPRPVSGRDVRAIGMEPANGP